MSFRKNHQGWVAALLLVLCTGAQAYAATADVDFFETSIRPLLADNCYKCHSEGKKKKGGLQLDTKQGLLKGGDNGPALVAGDVDKSLIIKAVHYKDENLQMPPDGKLSAAQIADLEAWIKMGAPDPRSGEVLAVASAKPVPITIDEARHSWAYQPPKAHTPPSLKTRPWRRTRSIASSSRSSKTRVCIPRRPPIGAR
jgi:hypothetical protein